MIALVAATAAGRSAAGQVARAWPGEARMIPGGVADALREAFTGCDAVVSFLATGATVRIVAPLLGDKADDPPVVCVDEARRFAVAVLGGHHGGNDLARRLSAVLGCEPVITTASDAVDRTPLDDFGADLGFRIENPDMLAPVGAAVLSGDPVGITGHDGWPLPAVPPNVTPLNHGDHAEVGHRISVTDEAGTGSALTFRPPSLVVGVGAASGTATAEIRALIDAALGGLSPLSLRCLATIDLKADEPGILEAAAHYGVPVETFPATTLAGIDVPNPSAIVEEEVGTPSVAEAAALHAARAAGAGADLIVPKRKSAGATVAVARLRPRGRLAIVGLGPGARDLLPAMAIAEIRRASVVVGLGQYAGQIRDLIRPGTRVLESGLGEEETRARTAVGEARAGRAVVLIGSGDAGIYAMGSPALEMADETIDVICVPGISAAPAAAALLGAPLGHDHAVISLSDLHTPWEAIERRIIAAATGDFTLCFYNPRSGRRTRQLPRAMEILRAHRPATTPVGLVRNAYRDGQRVLLTTIEEFDPDGADMYSIVIVGSGASRTVSGRFVTPRGYAWQ